MSIHVASIACLALFAASELFAQASAQAMPRRDVDVDDVTLEELLGNSVTIASGRLQRTEEAPSVVEVITDDDIRRRGARTLSEILQTVAGFEVRSDNVGRDLIAIRGISDPEGVLILFNGERLNDDITGAANQNNLSIPLYNVKRIEIIRGPGSALYGADAFIGVINLITYSSKDFHGTGIAAGGGSFGAQEYSAVTGHTHGDLGIASSFQFEDSDGPRLFVPADIQTLRDRAAHTSFSLAPGTVSKGNRVFDGAANVVYRGLRLDGRFHDERADGYVGLFDILGRNSSLTGRQWFVSASDAFGSGRWRLTPHLNFTQNTIGTLFDALPPGFAQPTAFGTVLRFPQGLTIDATTNSRRFSADAIVEERQSATGQKTFGASFNREATFDIRTLTNFDLTSGTSLPSLQPFPTPHLPRTSRAIASAFAQDVLEIGPVGVTGGVRYDHYSDFGSTVNPRAALVWRAHPHVHIKGLYGEAFRAPSFEELFFSAAGFVIGNPFLAPQKLRTSELSAVYSYRFMRASATYYHTDAKNLIVTTSPLSAEGVASTTTYVNSPGYLANGIELELQRTLGLDRSAYLNYSYQRATDRVTALPAPDLPRQIANGGYTFQFSRFVNLTPGFIWRGERARAAGDPRRLFPAYGLVNVNLRLKNFYQTLEVALTVNNALNKGYAYPSPPTGIPGDYPAPGRSAFVSARYKF